MEYLKLYVILIVFLPLLNAVIAAFLGNVIKRKGINVISILLMGISSVLSIIIFLGFYLKSYTPLNTSLYIWGITGGISLEVGFLIDKLTALMFVAVSSISFIVHVYSIGYMHDDSGYSRFFSYLSLFTFAMLALVSANNFLQLFFGWELCGLLSYLLISFWFTRKSAINAGLKAFLVNRIGDIAFILGIAAIYVYFGSLEYKEVFANVKHISVASQNISLFSNISFSVISFICISLFIGAMGKSAQVPLHVWLPDSMEGPTPISALIHAATMVGAGVFLVARMSPLFEYSAQALNFIMIIGTITCFFMGLLSIIQNDIKRIIAYSTISQLGYMMLAASASAYSIAIFHLFTHGFIKALLFLGAGSVIIGMQKEQNIRKMGNLKKYMPITFVTMFIASLSLVGIPGFSGFFSKDLIIEALHHSNLPFAKIATFIATVGVFVTAIYTFRLLFLVFYTKEKMDHYQKENLKESPCVIWIPLVLLAIPSIFIGGYFYNDVLNGELLSGIKSLPRTDVLIQISKSYPTALGFIFNGIFTFEFLFILLGIFVSWLCYIKHENLPVKVIKSIKPLFLILSNKYWFDTINQKVIVPSFSGMGWFFWRYIDKWFIDSFCVNGIYTSIAKVSNYVRKIQTGYLYHYVLFIVLSLLVLLVFLYTYYA